MTIEDYLKNKMLHKITPQTIQIDKGIADLRKVENRRILDTVEKKVKIESLTKGIEYQLNKLKWDI